MPYITISNAQSIIYRMDMTDVQLKGDIYKKDIDIFSKHEKVRLLAIQEFFKNPEIFIRSIYRPIKRMDTQKYVSEGNPPAYHEYNDCSRLNSDYKSFEIPLAVKEKGSTKVTQFRQWITDNQDLLEENPKAFAMRLDIAFGVRTNLKSVHHENSGHTEFKDIDLANLEAKIESLLNELTIFHSENEKHTKILNKYSKLSYLGINEKYTINNNTTGYSDTEVRMLLLDYHTRLKRPIQELLVDYYRVKYNSDINFKGSLLQQLGFVYCSECNKRSVKEFIDGRHTIKSKRDEEKPNKWITLISENHKRYEKDLLIVDTEAYRTIDLSFNNDNRILFISINPTLSIKIANQYTVSANSRTFLGIDPDYMFDILFNKDLREIYEVRLFRIDKNLELKYKTRLPNEEELIIRGI